MSEPSGLEHIDLETGLSGDDLFQSEVSPAIAAHVAPVFEDWCRAWVRANHGRTATRVGAWWGRSLNALRRRGERSSEQIDIVGTARGKVTLVGEAKWTGRTLDASIVSELDDYKMPALRHAGLRIASDMRIVLFSKAGYAAALRRRAEADDRITLVDVRAALA